MGQTSQIEGSSLQQVCLNWQNLQKSRKYMGPNHIGSHLFGASASFIKIVKKEPEGGFTKVKSGKSFEQFFEEPFDQKIISEGLKSWITKQSLEQYKECVENNRPVFARQTFSTPSGEIGYETVILPFCSEDAGEPDILAICSLPTGVDTYDCEAWLSALAETPWL